MEVIVEYDYSAKESDELTIKKGDIIRDVIKKSGGWWDGVLNEKRGLFPDNFVRLMDKDPVPVKNKKDFIQTRQCRVIFSYKQDHQDELSLNVGDIINIIGEEEEGWWRGLLQGKEGVFPSNFVEEIKPKFSSREDLTTPNDNNKSPVLFPKRSKILCQVKYSYKAQNEDELSLKEGDVINVISKDGLDPGWWKGELNGHIGVFPDNFVTIISNIDEKVNDSIESAILKPTAFIQRKSVEEKHENAIHNNRIIPPIPSKKPVIPIKKSPSGSSSQSGLLAGLRKKIVDVVDGTTSSKSVAKSNEILEEKQDAMLANVFDQVERTSMLPDVRATRAKAPGRRPPSVVFKESELGIINGNVDQSEMEGIEASTCLYSINNKSSEEIKPKLRGWEKHKAPWLEEMKLNQAKRTSTSPGPEQNKLKITHSDICVASDTEVLAETILPVEAVSTNSTDKVQSTANEIDKNVVVRNKLPVSSFQISQNINHTATVSSTASSIQKPPNTEKTKILPVNLENTSTHQYNELLERLERLELKLQQQELVHKAAIEDLQNKLQLETDMRRLLQTELDKLSQCIMQV